MGLSFDILKYWERMSTMTPVLANYAKRCVGMLVTSVDCERDFSDYRRILTDHREPLNERSIK